MTNEDVADTLWQAFNDWTDQAVERSGGAFHLVRLELEGAARTKDPSQSHDGRE
jgi:hypothetical protein